MPMKTITAALTVLLLSNEVQANANDKRFEVCRSKLVVAQKLEMLYDFDWKPPREPKVIAGPTFFKVPIDAKEGFVESVNCFLAAGDEKKCINFDVRSWQTGKKVGRFSNCQFEMN